MNPVISLILPHAIRIMLRFWFEALNTITQLGQQLSWVIKRVKLSQISTSPTQQGQIRSSYQQQAQIDAVLEVFPTVSSDLTQVSSFSFFAPICALFCACNHVVSLFCCWFLCEFIILPSCVDFWASFKASVFMFLASEPAFVSVWFRVCLRRMKGCNYVLL